MSPEHDNCRPPGAFLGKSGLPAIPCFLSIPRHNLRDVFPTCQEKKHAFQIDPGTTRKTKQADVLGPIYPVGTCNWRYTEKRCLQVPPVVRAVSSLGTLRWKSSVSGPGKNRTSVKLSNWNQTSIVRDRKCEDFHTDSPNFPSQDADN